MGYSASRAMSRAWANTATRRAGPGRRPIGNAWVNLVLCTSSSRSWGFSSSSEFFSLSSSFGSGSTDGGTPRRTRRRRRLTNVQAGTDLLLTATFGGGTRFSGRASDHAIMPEEHAPSRGTPAVEGYRGQNTTEPLDAYASPAATSSAGTGASKGHMAAPSAGSQRTAAPQYRHGFGDSQGCCAAPTASVMPTPPHSERPTSSLRTHRLAVSPSSDACHTAWEAARRP